jgi:hypothetical protein
VYVQPTFLFIKLQDLIDQLLPECVNMRFLDTGEFDMGRSVMPPIVLSFAGEPFVRVADPSILEQVSVSDCAQGNFVPGVLETGRGDRALQELTCTSHITPGESHYFCPPECDGDDVCHYTAIGPTIPLGVCFPPLPDFPSAHLGDDCPGGVGDCSPVVPRYRPCSGGFGFAIQLYGNRSCIPLETTCDGACCNGGNCVLSTKALCEGTYQGDDTVCSDYEPTITQQPEDAFSCVGGDAEFTITATAGSGALHYQWKKDGSNVGTDSPTLTLNNVQASDNGAQITCEVRDDCATVTSDAATLTVVEIGQSGNPTDTLWWFDGENAANYSERVTLTANGASTGTFAWTVTAGQGKINFENGADTFTATDDNTVDIDSTAASASAAVVTNDITIELRIDGELVCTFDTVVFAPDHLVHTGDTDNPVGANGYQSLVGYRIEDQFNQVLPHNVEINEDWGATVSDFAGENWVAWNVPCAGDPTGENCEGAAMVPPGGWADNMTRSGAGFTPPRLNPQTPLGNVRVDHRPGTWRCGSTTVAIGPANNPGEIVRNLTWQLYQDHGRNE